MIHFSTKGDFLNSRQKIFYLAFQETTLISMQQLMTRDKLPVMFYVGNCKGCKKKQTTFCFAWESGQELSEIYACISHGSVELLHPLGYNTSVSQCFLLLMPPCNLYYHSLTSILFSHLHILGDAKGKGKVVSFYLSFIGLDDRPIFSLVFQGGVGPVRICPSFMLFSH